MKAHLDGGYLDLQNFGPDNAFCVICDEDGLSKPKYQTTAEINRIVYCGPLLIVKNQYSPEEFGTISVGLSAEECATILRKINLLSGRGKKPAGGFQVIGFENTKDLLDTLDSQRRFAQKENNDNWSK